MNDACTQIDVLKKSTKEATFDDFVAELPEHECRYAVYDYEYTSDDGRPTGKVLFVVWAPGALCSCCVISYLRRAAS